MKSILPDLESFVLKQKNNWELAKNNYSSLLNINNKAFELLGNKIVVQFNPERIKSSTAAVDKKSIRERNCFLCDENRPIEQDEIILNQNYKLLLNPYPIFNPHFTISSKIHKIQNINPEFGDLIYFIDQIGDKYTIFYNGPECGASAPDHMHFQACPRNVLPIEKEYFDHKKRNVCKTINSKRVEINFIQDGLRNYIGIEFSDHNDGKMKFDEIINILKKIDENYIEPKINLICFKNINPVVLIFPRQNHRPDFYFKDDEDQILISPAAVDMGGVIICPRENDFNKLNENLLIEMFTQICYKNDKFKVLLDAFDAN